MGSVIAILRKEHKNIARLLDALEHQVALLEKGARPDYDVLQDIADYFCDYPDRCHHPKEDAVFAQLRAKHPDAAAKIGDLAGEHRETAERAHKFRDDIKAVAGEGVMPRGALVDSAQRFIDAERAHMRMEETVFFPLAEKTLGEADWLEVGRRLKEEHDPLFGEIVEAEYRALRERMLAWEKEYKPG